MSGSGKFKKFDYFAIVLTFSNVYDIQDVPPPKMYILCPS